MYEATRRYDAGDRNPVKLLSHDMVNFTDLPIELLLEISGLLAPNDTKLLSLVNRTCRHLTVSRVFSHIRVRYSRTGFRQLKELCHSPYTSYVRKVSYVVPFLQSTGNQIHMLPAHLNWRELTNGYRGWQDIRLCLQTISHPWVSTDIHGIRAGRPS